jgi:hypothetical protein
MKVTRSWLIKIAEKQNMEVHDLISRIVREDPDIEIEDDTKKTI